RQGKYRRRGPRRLHGATWSAPALSSRCLCRVAPGRRSRKENPGDPACAADLERSFGAPHGLPGLHHLARESLNRPFTRYLRIDEPGPTSGIKRYVNMQEHSAEGVIGMPSAASPEIGKKLYDGALGALEQAVRALQSL